MTGKDIFKKWTPIGSKWIEWVRPVPFAAIDNMAQANGAYHFTIPGIIYIKELKIDTAIILDIPGYDSIEEGLALAKLGYRPIPLFNGTDEQQGTMALVDNHMIKSALVWGALELEKLKIAKNAPPAFLLDSNRTHRFKMNVSVFDNSWDLYPQDIPSSEYFLKNGISQIIIRGDKIQKDLVKILYEFQKNGITLLFTNGYEYSKEVIIKKPSRKDK